MDRDPKQVWYVAPAGGLRPLSVCHPELSRRLGEEELVNEFENGSQHRNTAYSVGRGRTLSHGAPHWNGTRASKNLSNQMKEQRVNGPQLCAKLKIPS